MDVRSFTVTVSAMVQCQHCGRENADQTQFCRFCGNRMSSAPAPKREDYQHSPPRPYSWKTDEYQTQAERRIQPASASRPMHSADMTASSAQPLAYNAPQYIGANYRCPNCGTTTLPIIERRISTAGWITFSLLLVFTFIFFWIGLLMKQDVSVCPVCRAALS
jgi:rubrerythrin